MNVRYRSLFVGLYAWVAAVFFGGTLIDKVYSNYLKGAPGASGSALVFSELADSLLCVGFVTIITASGAIAVSWNSKIAKNLFISSLVVFSLEFLIPIFASLINKPLDLAWTRLLPSGIASILTFIGFYKYCRQ